MGGRNPARYLAPIALVATIAGTYLIVHSRLSASSAPASHASIGGPQHKYPHQRFYTVQANDSFSTIAVKTGIPVPTLETLNPSVAPNTLQTGQRLRLRR